MRMKHKLWILALTGLLSLGLVVALANRGVAAQPPPPDDSGLLTALQMGSDHFGLDWNVVGSGESEIASTHFRIRSTIGQPVVGTARNDPYELCTGYWCGAAVEHSIYLPLVLRAA